MSKNTEFIFDCSKWTKGSRILTQKGYSIAKSILSTEQDKWIRNTLTVKPYAPPPYDKAI
jgi:hypothetical protein